MNIFFFFWGHDVAFELVLAEEWECVNAVREEKKKKWGLTKRLMDLPRPKRLSCRLNRVFLKTSLYGFLVTNYDISDHLKVGFSTNTVTQINRTHL